MGREERKLKKHFEQREQNERRKLARQNENTKYGRVHDGPAQEDGLLAGQIIRTAPLTVRLNDRDALCRAVVNCAIGDRVMFSPARQQVVRVLPRSTVLSRTDPHNPRIQLVMAANMDVVVNVVSAKSPPLSPGLIDRFLIAIGHSGAAPLICVNKVDLGRPQDELRPYIALGVPLVFCSAATGEGLDNLRAAISGRLCVFTGHSGVGKSSLLNALEPGLAAATGDVSEANRKGRHTTTSSQIYELPDGARLIDTPGIRELALWNVTSAQIQLYFEEFSEFAWRCAFSGCTHTHEPRCAVKDALQQNLIAPARYNAYLRIRASIAAGGGEP